MFDISTASRSLKILHCDCFILTLFAPRFHNSYSLSEVLAIVFLAFLHRLVLEEYTFNMFHNLLTTIGISATLLSAVRADASIDYTALGPSTSLASKSTICSVLDYGGVADGTTDVGPAILEAFSSCAAAGGATLYIPPGNYSSRSIFCLLQCTAY